MKMLVEWKNLLQYASYMDKDKRSNNKRTDPIDTIICTGRIGRCIEEEFFRSFRIGRSRIWVSKRILLKLKKEFRE